MLMRTIREILLTEYIGAILIAVLVADVFNALITQAVTQISYHFYLAKLFGMRERLFSPAYSALEASLKIALYLAVAYLLARWLYPAGQSSAADGAESRIEPESGGKP